jgi:hypothetical protein
MVAEGELELVDQMLDSRMYAADFSCSLDHRLTNIQMGTSRGKS